MAYSIGISPLYKKLLVIAGLLAALGSGYWFYTRRAEGIYPYNAGYDRAFILDLFKRNWEWLIASPDYSVEYALDTKSSSKELNNKGNLTIYVYRKTGSKPVGLVAFYKKRFFEGRVLFVAVDENERGKGYARLLLSYALEELKKQGCTVVTLITRVANERGRKLYTGMGFTQVWTDGYFIKFEKHMN